MPLHQNDSKKAGGDSKGARWDGYYRWYLEEAERQDVSAADLLDKLWADGAETAVQFVLPFINADSRVLEIACGIGRVSRFVAPACRSLCCTDILDVALSEARKTLAEFDNVEFLKTDGYTLLGLADQSFDCVYSFTAFFHFDWEVVVGYFAEIQRVLRPGGVGIIEFKPCRRREDFEQLLRKIEQVGGVKNYESKLDKWRYVSGEMLSMVCENYGFEVIDMGVTQYTFRRPSN